MVKDLLGLTHMLPSFFWDEMLGSVMSEGKTLFQIQLYLHICLIFIDFISELAFSLATTQLALE